MILLKVRNILILLLIPILSGCSQSPDKGVVEFVKETKKQKSGYVENIPDYPSPIVIKYSAEEERDPFDPNSTLRAASADTYKHQHEGPDLSRPREELEEFTLSSLKMVGTLEREGIFYALIQDPSNIVHLAGIGNYIGENSGQIEKINDTEIDVKEWLPDGKGGWRSHETSLPFLHEDSKSGNVENGNNNNNKTKDNSVIGVTRDIVKSQGRGRP